MKLPDYNMQMKHFVLKEKMLLYQKKDSICIAIHHVLNVDFLLMFAILSIGLLKSEIMVLKPWCFSKEKSLILAKLDKTPDTIHFLKERKRN